MKEITWIVMPEVVQDACDRCVIFDRVPRYTLHEVEK